MKKIISNNRIIAIAFFTAFSFAAAMPASAGEQPVLPVKLVYVGQLNSQPLFQLNVSGNEQHDHFSIIIRDEAGNILFWENIRSENFSKKFLLNTDEIGDDTLQLEVVSRKARQSVKYEINRHTRLVEEVDIVKVK